MCRTLSLVFSRWARPPVCLSNTLSVLRPTPAPGRGAGGRDSKWHFDTQAGAGSTKEDKFDCASSPPSSQSAPSSSRRVRAAGGLEGRWARLLHGPSALLQSCSCGCGPGALIDLSYHHG